MKWLSGKAFDVLMIVIAFAFVLGATCWEYR